jgi:conjugal transfer/entry exclusion protein
MAALVDKTAGWLTRHRRAHEQVAEVHRDAAELHSKAAALFSQHGKPDAAQRERELAAQQTEDSLLEQELAASEPSVG